MMCNSVHIGSYSKKEEKGSKRQSYITSDWLAIMYTGIDFPVFLRMNSLIEFINREPDFVAAEK